MEVRIEEFILCYFRKRKINGKYKIDVRCDWSFIRRRGEREWGRGYIWKNNVWDYFRIVERY